MWIEESALGADSHPVWTGSRGVSLESEVAVVGTAGGVAQNLAVDVVVDQTNLLSTITLCYSIMRLRCLQSLGSPIMFPIFTRAYHRTPLRYGAIRLVVCQHFFDELLPPAVTYHFLLDRPTTSCHLGPVLHLANSHTPLLACLREAVEEEIRMGTNQGSHPTVAAHSILKR